MEALSENQNGHGQACAQLPKQRAMHMTGQVVTQEQSILEDVPSCTSEANSDMLPVELKHNNNQQHQLPDEQMQQSQQPVKKRARTTNDYKVGSKDTEPPICTTLRRLIQSYSSSHEQLESQW
ncbi:hypothetical protein MHU86_1737 [Fragilaria crotonensis]|nr:hypothetical protein MHU86_1737 [Fragilaria crotonensis]